MSPRSNTAEVLAFPTATATRERVVRVADTTPISTECWEREMVARRLPEYQLVREIGRGAMGVVFLARDVVLHRLVAVKVLRRELAGGAEQRARFLREARMTARLSHANIVPVHTFGDDGELSYIVMKYVDGESLAQRLRGGALPPDEVRRILRELALALDYAHGQAVIHRDLKAENILLERGTGRAMLTDFGVALLRSLDPVRAEWARAYGTPHYMSPEQAVGELDIDGRSDLYSLGVLGYYMASGRLPFHASTFEALAAKHIAEPHVPLARTAPRTPRFVRDAIERCLRKERSDRWRSGADLAAALQEPRRGWMPVFKSFA